MGAWCACRKNELFETSCLALQNFKTRAFSDADFQKRPMFSPETLDSKHEGMKPLSIQKARAERQAPRS